jgi:misacylated tRNA(Ala) deacylase
MKNLLYLEDSYLKEFDAEVIEANGRYIILDKTAFYPNSGGQLFDTGIIKRDNEEFNVVYVGKFNGKISHEVDKEGLKKGDKVKCKINWERRYKLMRSHTSAHIISQIIHQETSALITGNQLKLDENRVDFSVDEYNPDDMQKYIDMANEIIEKDLPVSKEYITREEAEKRPELARLAKGLPDGVKEIRLVKIGDFDIQADGGTHVKSTKEIGKIILIKCKNKGKNNRRLYFKIEP